MKRILRAVIAVAALLLVSMKAGAVVWAEDSFKFTFRVEDVKGNLLGLTSNTVTSDLQVSVTVPDVPGYRFARWQPYNVEVVSMDGTTCMIKVTGTNPSLIAVMEPVSYQLMVAATEGGTVVGTTGGSIAYLDSVLLKAEPSAGYLFVGWHNGEGYVSIEKEFSFIMPAKDCTVTAVFEAARYALAVDCAYGEVTVEPSKIYYNCGDGITASTEPLNGYQFLGWYDGTEFVSSDYRYHFNMPDKDYALQAVFVPIMYALSVEITGDVGFGGVEVSPDSGYQAGEEVALTAYPVTGGVFAGWYEGEQLLSSELTYVFRMPASDYSLRAVFREDKSSVTVRDNLGKGDLANIEGGNAQGSYRVGSTLSVIAKELEGYTFAGWMDTDGNVVEHTRRYTFKLESQPVILIANYTPNLYILEVSSEDVSFGQVGFTADGELQCGIFIYVQATPKEGHSFDGWYEGNNKVSGEIRYGFSMPARNVSLVAKFTEDAAVTTGSFTFLHRSANENVIFGYDGSDARLSAERAGLKFVAIDLPIEGLRCSYEGDGVVAGAYDTLTVGTDSFKVAGINYFGTLVQLDKGYTVSPSTLRVGDNLVRVTFWNGIYEMICTLSVKVSVIDEVGSLQGIRVDPDRASILQGSLLDKSNFTVYGVYLYKGKQVEIEMTSWDCNYSTSDRARVDVTGEYIYQPFQVTASRSGTLGVSNTTLNLQITLPKLTCHRCGYEYTPDSDGGDPDCPVCRVTPVSFRPLENPVIVAKGVVLPSVAIEVTYRDGNKEYFHDGYGITGYNKEQAGEQFTTLLLDGTTLTAPLTVIVEDYQPIAPANPIQPDVIDLDDYQYQLAGTARYLREMLKEMEQDGSTSFHSGDYVTVTVTIDGKVFVAGMKVR